MPLTQLLGTDLDAISRSHKKVSSYRVLLFDLLAGDSISDITLNRHKQIPVDITPYVVSVEITQSHDTDTNQATVQVASAGVLDWRLFNYSWVKIYEGDSRVDQGQWPVVFSGQFKGSPARSLERGRIEMFSHTAHDRSIFYRHNRITSRRNWQPNDSDANLGEICVEIATNANWGMGLDRQEVLFGLFYDKYGQEVRINKKLQVVDIPPMEALRNIMQVVQLEPAFNGEGRLVARPVDLDKPAFRGYEDGGLLISSNVSQNSSDTPTSVVVRGLDYRVSRVEWREQKLLDVGPTVIGMFDPRVQGEFSYSEENEFRAVPNPSAKNVKVRGDLLGQIFALDSKFSVSVERIDDFQCRAIIEFDGVFQAILIVTAEMLAYLGLKVAAGAIGQTGFWSSAAAWALDAAATLILFSVMQMMVAIGTVTFEVHGVPFEFVYQELEAKAMLADTFDQEDNPEEVENHILGTLEECETLARTILRRRVAETAQRELEVSYDFLIEPNDVVSYYEDGESARMYVQGVTKILKRGSFSASLSLVGYRIA